VQTHSDVLGLSLILPNETESVLLGAAMLGASAAEKYSNESASVIRILHLLNTSLVHRTLIFSSHTSFQ
jgi:ribulose kinase